MEEEFKSAVRRFREIQKFKASLLKKAHKGSYETSENPEYFLYLNESDGYESELRYIKEKLIRTEKIIGHERVLSCISDVINEEKL